MQVAVPILCLHMLTSNFHMFKSDASCTLCNWFFLLSKYLTVRTSSKAFSKFNPAIFEFDGNSAVDFFHQKSAAKSLAPMKASSKSTRSN